MAVKPVDGWSDRRRFLDLPWTLYRNDPNWIPPLRLVQKELVGYRHHPFYEQAECQTFLARRGGEVVGRIAGIVNRAHNVRYGEQRGFFGFFESVDDPVVATALFDAVRQWLALRGIHSVRGPANPSMNYECGLLVSGFDSPPTFLMTYNPPYYERLFEQYGFRKAHDLLAFLGYRAQLPEFFRRMAPLAGQAQEWCQAKIRQMTPTTEDIDLFLDLYNRSFQDMWGFVPLSRHEIKEFVDSLRYLVDPELALIAEVDGRGVGGVIGLPDFNPRIKKINGRLFPFGFLKLIGKQRDIKRIRVMSINVVPEFQRWGLGLVLLNAMVPKALDMGVEEAEFSWIAESNALARMGMEKADLLPFKTYRMYDLERPALASAS